MHFKHFKKGDLVVWRPEFLASKLRYNKSKNKRKGLMVDHFDTPWPHKEAWPMGIMTITGYDNQSSHLVELRDNSFGPYQFVYADYKQLVLASEVMSAEDLELATDLMQLGF